MPNLSAVEVKDLRDRGLLSEDENPIKIGDKIFAESILTFKRRLILDQTVGSVTETRQLLKD